MAAVEALATQLAAAEEEAPLFVADSGLYSAQNVARLSAAGVRWISRVPETSKPALQAVQRTVARAEQVEWQQAGDVSWAPVAQPPAGERWVVVHTTPGVERARATLARKAEQTRGEWEQALWHLSAQRFACEPDAQKALNQQLKKRPDWLQIQTQLRAHPTHERPGRPRQDAAPDGHVWQVEARVTLDPAALERAGWSARRCVRRAFWSPPTCSTPCSSPTRSSSRPTKSNTASSADLLS